MLEKHTHAPAMPFLFDEQTYGELIHFTFCCVQKT